MHLVLFWIFFIAQKGLNFEELERAGCRELLKKIIGKGVVQFKLATDRHSGIRAMIRDDETFSSVTHYFDIWHLAKSIGKILKELTKLKRNESLIPWKQSIINHFWFSYQGDKYSNIKFSGNTRD